jgi:hypothetical protein
MGMVRCLSENALACWQGMLALCLEFPIRVSQHGVVIQTWRASSHHALCGWMTLP